MSDSIEPQTARIDRNASQYARSLIEASLDPLVTISPEGKITDVNEGSIKVTGVRREALIGTDFSNYFTEPEQARAGYQQVFAKGFVTDYPLTIRHSDGGLTDVLYNASVYKDAAGNVLGVFAAARDVTAQRQASQYARSLIEAVAAQARLQGAARYYWLTQEHNAVARVLYDKVAKHAGFIRYDFPLRGPGA